MNKRFIENNKLIKMNVTNYLEFFKKIILIFNL